MCLCKQARYLQDHGVPQIPLTWERGMQLYQFYLPDELPEFDSYRVTSISADVECLLRRTAALVPPHYKPGDIFSICILFFKKENHIRKYMLFVPVGRFTGAATWLVLVKHSSNGVLLALNVKPYFLSLIYVNNIAFMQIFRMEEVLVPFIVLPEMLYKVPSLPEVNWDHKNVT
jgi:hypothetical protein